ncbi:MAG TPA: Calx-beta domain-containing protein [Pyrinomonadaceae bacterium]|jgi:CSLREA domain-containing protein|nr:Calx-beta domain-containing protein [Pyrinomonadaceae bacterium]
MRLLTRLCCVLFVALLPLLSSPLTPTASASNFTVNSFGDTPDANTSDGLCADSGGACTLRAAIQQANADPPGDVIGFGVTGVVNLTSALPTISKSVTINGPGAQQLFVRRDFNLGGVFRVFNIGAGATVSISGLTVMHGLAPPATVSDAPGGGGIYNAGQLTLTGVNVSHNSVPSSPWPVPFTPHIMQGGGGIQNDGVLTMTGCKVTENSTGSGVDGNSNISGGNGGGILNKGTLAMTNCAVALNTTGRGADSSPSGGFGGDGGAGGGIYNAASGPGQVGATLTNCAVTGNTTGNGGAVVNGPQADLAQSGDGGLGGGVYNASNMTIVGSRINNNQTGTGANAPQGKRTQAGKGGAGGGIYNDIPAGGGEMKLTNCVISSNRTGEGGVGSGEVISEGNGGNGGGIANPSADSVLKASQCTIVSNQTGLAGDGGGHDGVGGGIYGALRIRSNLIALNFVRFPTNLSDVAGDPPVSLGFNFLGFFGTLSGHSVSTDFGSNNSGPLAKLDQFTLIPQPGSIVIDAGLARDLDDTAITTDIRGAARPFDFPDVAPRPGSDDSDVGALERQATDPTPTPSPAPTPTPSPTPTPATVQFSALTGHVAEACAQSDITVTRTGPKDGTTTAEYFVTDASDTGAHWRGDFTYARGKVTFAPGEDTKTIPVLLTEDAYHEQPEELKVQIVGVEGSALGTPDIITLTIDDNDATDGTANPIDDNTTFICQHYHDFLSRHADPGGQAFWTARLAECNGDAACLDRKRVDVSAAFFLSIEFQNTGYYVIRVNKVGLGDLLENPTFLEFEDDAQSVARGVIVGQPGFEMVLEANKQRYAEEFVMRGDFQTFHGGQAAGPYVDTLFANAGVTPTTQERDAAVAAFGAGGVAGQAAALRSIVESGSVYNKLYNPSFVLMQYFGYLRRNPNDRPDNNFSGYLFWLDKLNAATLPGEDARDPTVAIRRIYRAEMIRAFLRSTEYRGRFAGDTSRGNP